MPDNGNRITNPYLRRTALHEAVIAGDLKRVQGYLDQGAKVDAADSQGQTALHMAIGKPKIFRELLKHEPNLAAHTQEEGQTALHMAAEKGDLECIRACLDAGAELEIPSKPFKFGREKGATPLHIALQAGQMTAVKLLMQAGADSKAASENGWTAMHFAAQSDKPEAIKFLVNEGHADMLNTHTDLKENARTPLFLAVTNRKVEAVKTLLKLGGDPAQRDRNLWTPLHEAARVGGNRGGEIAKALVEAGADLNKPLTDKHQTPLYIALQNNNSRMSRFLLEQGADPNITGEFGKTPLHMAAGRDDPELVETLLKCGAYLSVRDSEGNTPLHLAAKNDNERTVILLLQAGANPTIKNRHAQTPDQMSRSPRGREIRELLKKSRKIANDNKYMKKKGHNGISPIEKPPQKRGPRNRGPGW